MAENLISDFRFRNDLTSFSARVGQAFLLVRFFFFSLSEYLIQNADSQCLLHYKLLLHPKLQFAQTSVQTVFWFQKFLMSAIFHNSPMIKHQNHICLPDG